MHNYHTFSYDSCLYPRSLDAVENLIAVRSTVDECRLMLRQMPDIDRLLSRVHSMGLKLAPDHPETRAVYYEMPIYNKRKIKDFLTALKGLKVHRRDISKSFFSA